MEASLLEIYPGRPDPTCQMPLSVGISFLYFETFRNLSLNIIHMKRIQILIIKHCFLLCCFCFFLFVSSLLIREKSQKDRILTASKTIWMLTSWHKTLIPALGSELIMDV